MLEKIIHFLKYNNATIIILALILILGGGALAAGPEAIGEKETSIQGVDNTALLAADLDNLNLDFKIERLEQDDQYYYVTYSFLDLNQADHLWQYQLSQKTRKVSKKIKDDLGLYLAKFLAKHYEARLRELKQEKERAKSAGEQKRVAVTEYSGLIGQTLNLASKVFPGYEPVKKVELPTPENFALPTAPVSLSTQSNSGVSAPAQSGADNLTKIYNDYIAEHPEILNLSAGSASSTPASPEILKGGPEQSEIAASSTLATPEILGGGSEQTGAAEPTPTPTETPAPSAGSADSQQAGSGQDIVEPTNVEVIELPTPSPTPTPEPPVATPETTPEPDSTPTTE